MLTNLRVSQSSTDPSIQQWFTGNLGYNIVDRFMEELEMVDRNYF